MSEIKRQKPHGLIFVMNGSQKIGPELQYALTCFKECLKRSVDSNSGLPLGRILLVTNQIRKVEAASLFQVGEDQNQVVAKIMDETNEALKTHLEQSIKITQEHCFGMIMNDTPANMHDTVKKIRAAIKLLDKAPLDVAQFRTFDEVRTEANALLSGAISAEANAARKKQELEYDIKWHENRIHDCNVAALSTCWIPFAGIACGIGFGAAIADSNAKLPALREQLKNVMKDKEGNLARAKKKASDWHEKLTKLEKAMDGL